MRTARSSTSSSSTTRSVSKYRAYWIVKWIERLKPHHHSLGKHLTNIETTKKAAKLCVNNIYAATHRSNLWNRFGMCRRCRHVSSATPYNNAHEFDVTNFMWARAFRRVFSIRFLIVWRNSIKYHFKWVSRWIEIDGECVRCENINTSYAWLLCGMMMTLCSPTRSFDWNRSRNSLSAGFFPRNCNRTRVEQFIEII